MCVYEGFSSGSAGKESACSAEDVGSIPGLGRSPGKGKGYPLQYSGLENSMDYSPWGCKESDTTAWLSPSLCVCVHLLVNKTLNRWETSRQTYSQRCSARPGPGFRKSELRMIARSKETLKPARPGLQAQGSPHLLSDLCPPHRLFKCIHQKYGKPQKPPKGWYSGTSLAVQWLRLHLPMQGLQVESQIGGM